MNWYDEAFSAPDPAAALDYAADQVTSGRAYSPKDFRRDVQKVAAARVRLRRASHRPAREHDSCCDVVQDDQVLCAQRPLRFRTQAPQEVAQHLVVGEMIGTMGVVQTLRHLLGQKRSGEALSSASARGLTPRHQESDHIGQVLAAERPFQDRDLVRVRGTQRHGGEDLHGLAECHRKGCGAVAGEPFVDGHEGCDVRQTCR